MRLPPRHMPTTEEILQKCEQIRSEWSERERLIRAGADPDEIESDTLWHPPEVTVPHAKRRLNTDLE